VKKGLVAILTCLFFIVCCAPLHQETFTSKSIPSENIITLNADLDNAYKIVQRALVKNGFNLQTSPEKTMLEARKILSKGKTSDEIYLQCYFEPQKENTTTITAVATEKITKSSTHVKVFWLIFIPIPYGTYVTTGTAKERTITDQWFYKGLFEEIGSVATEYEVKVL